MNKFHVSEGFTSNVALLISIYFPPEPGGAATAASNRASMLQKIGYKVFVLCGFPSYPNGKVMDPLYRNKLFYIEKKEKLTLIRLRLLPLRSKGYLRRLILFLNFIFLSMIWMPKILKMLKPNLVYAITPTLFSCIIGKCYSNVTKSFLIYESTDLWPEQLIAMKASFFSFIEFFGHILARISYLLPDLIVVTSNFASEYVIKHYQPHAIVYPLPLGIDTDVYKTISKESSRADLIQNKIISHRLEKKFIVLYAGTLNQVTKVENLFYAAKKLKNSGNNDVFFLIIGEGDERETLEKIKYKEQLNNLALLSFPPRRFVPEIISSADVCVVTLSAEPAYRATIPTKFYDYLACHKPQIGICEGELANLIESNKIGITVKIGEIDKLVKIILELRTSPSLLQNMEENSRSVMKRYSLEALAPKLQEVIRKEISL